MVEDIQAKIDALLNEAEVVMQSIEKSAIPCEKIILSTLQRIDKWAWKYFAESSLTAAVGCTRQVIRLRKKYPAEAFVPSPYSDKPQEPLPEQKLNITIDLNYNSMHYWWRVSYKDQVMILKSLPKLIEKLIDNVKNEYVAEEMEVLVDVPPETPKPKPKKWWQRRAK